MEKLTFLHKILLLSLGGTTGTLLRYFVYQFADRYLNKVLPWGTLLVNLTGSFAIGFIWGLLEKTGLPPAFRLFVFIGILGSFTTFSTFAFDSYNLLHQGAYKLLLLNLTLQNIGGLTLCVFGIYLAKII